MPPKEKNVKGEEDEGVNGEGNLAVPWRKEQDDMLFKEMLQWMYDNRSAIRLLPGPQQWYDSNSRSSKIFFSSLINRRVILELKQLAKQRGVVLDESGTKGRQSSPRKKRQLDEDDAGWKKEEDAQKKSSKAEGGSALQQKSEGGKKKKKKQVE